MAQIGVMIDIYIILVQKRVKENNKCHVMKQKFRSEKNNEKNWPYLTDAFDCKSFAPMRSWVVLAGPCMVKLCMMERRAWDNSCNKISNAVSAL